MTLLTFIHIFLMGIWLGVVLVEAVLEIFGHRNPDRIGDVTKIHYNIDRFLELPILILISVVGITIFDSKYLSNNMYLAKMVFGVITVTINFLCVIPVFKRKSSLDKQHESGIRKQSQMIYWYFYIGGATGFAALTTAVIIVSSR